MELVSRVNSPPIHHLLANYVINVALPTVLSYGVPKLLANALLMPVEKITNLTCKLLFLIMAIAHNSHAAEDFDLLITDVTLIDAVSGVRPNHSVGIRNGRIVKIIPGSIQTRANILGGKGMYLIPGLWDMHVHIVYEPALINHMPSLFLDYGITSVRDTGALLNKIKPEVGRWLKLGNEAPDLYFSGPLLDGALIVYDGNGRTEIGTSVASPGEADDVVEELKANGASFIKIYELVSPEVFKALVVAAANQNLPIAAHVPLSMIADEAGPAVNSMEHLRNIDLACADNANDLHRKRISELQANHDRTGYELRSHLHSTQRAVAYETADPTTTKCGQVIDSLINTIQVPTLRLNTIVRYSPLKRPDWHKHLGKLPEDVAGKWLATAKYFAARPSDLDNQMSDWSLSLVGEMNRRGVPIGAGTDTPIGQAIPGYSLHTELERLVDAGLTPLQALGTATIQPARFFGQRGHHGEIRVGMEADLVMLKANPLEDIRNTRSIMAVISNGERVR